MMAIRRFLIATLLGLFTAAGLHAEGFRPDRMMLTWQRDPTTTMTIQWLQGGHLLPLMTGHDEYDPRFAVVYDVPAVGPLDVATDASDWWDRGLALDFLANQQHQQPAVQDLDARVRIGWNEQGLVLAIQVRDDIPMEDASIDRLWDGDSVEVMLSDGSGSDHRYQVTVSPGRDPNHPEPRVRLYDYPHGPPVEQLSVPVSVVVTEEGYTVQMLLLWSNLPRFTAKPGATLAVQVYVNDRDRPGRAGWQWVAWHPSRHTPRYPAAKRVIRLAQHAEAPVRLRAVMQQRHDGTVLALHGSLDLAGQAVTLRPRITGSRPQEPIAVTHWQPAGDQAYAQMMLPDLPAEHRMGVLEVVMDEQVVDRVASPAWLAYRAPQPMTLRYWPADGDETQAKTAVTTVTPIMRWGGQFRQRVELTGLEPGTMYRFAVGDNERSYAFRTMPSDLSQPIRLAVGGDTRHRQEWMEQMNRVAMRYKPDLMLWGGDFAYADGQEERLYRWEEWFEAIHNTMIDDDGRVIPIVGGIGNHEVVGGYYYRHDDYQPTDVWRTHIAPFFYQFFAFPGQPGYGVLDFGNYLSLIMLDSAHTNPIEGLQTDWLETTLADRVHVPHVFPVYHVTAYPSVRRYDGRVEQAIRRYWTPLFERYGVRVAFENHDHAYKRTHPIRQEAIDPGGVVYVGDGAWGVGERRGHDPAETWYLARAEAARHAILVTLHHTHQHLLVVDHTGRIIDEYPATGLMQAIDQ